MSWSDRVTNDLVPFGLVPADLLDESALGVIGVTTALESLLTAKDRELARQLACKMVTEALTSTGQDFTRAMKLILEYTAQSADAGGGRDVRIIEIVQRAEGYRSGSDSEV